MKKMVIVALVSMLSLAAAAETNLSLPAGTAVKIN